MSASRPHALIFFSLHLFSYLAIFFFYAACGANVTAANVVVTESGQTVWSQGHFQPTQPGVSNMFATTTKLTAVLLSGSYQFTVTITA